MKTFGDLKIGDELFYINEEFSVRSCKIDGIRNMGLQNTEIEIYRVGSRNPIPVNASDIKCTFHTKLGIDKNIPFSVTYYSCLEAAKETQHNIRTEYIKEQFRIAKQAFNRIKKLSPKDESLKKRIFDFFNISECSGEE